MSHLGTAPDLLAPQAPALLARTIKEQALELLDSISSVQQPDVTAACAFVYDEKQASTPH